MINTAVLRPTVNLRYILTLLAVSALVLLLMSIFGVAHAQTTGGGGLDSALAPAAGKICGNLQSFTQSVIVGVIALALFIGGGVMVWLKIRGGLALVIAAVAGYFLIRQLVPILKGLGIDVGSCATP